MQHLQSAAQFFNALGEFAGNHAGSFHAQDGSQAFSAGKHAVPHGLVNGFRPLRRWGQQSFQGLVNGPLALQQGFFKHEQLSITRADETKGSANFALPSLWTGGASGRAFYAAWAWDKGFVLVAAITMARTSEALQQSAAPTARASVHILSSARRCVQTIMVAPNSLCSS